MSQNSAKPNVAKETGGHLEKNTLANLDQKEILLRILYELRGIRLAMTAIACDGGKYVPEDFNPLGDISFESFDNEGN